MTSFDSSALTAFLEQKNTCFRRFNGTITTTIHPDVQPTEIWVRGSDSLLGKGGLGVVYKEFCDAYDPRKFRAVKEIDANTSSEFSFENEIKTMAKLARANRGSEYFVTLHAWYRDDLIKDKVYIAMEYCHLGDLSSNVSGGLSDADVQQLGRELLVAVNIMHEQGIVHYDLKPENILVSSPGPSWRIKIADFGFSQQRLKRHYAHVGGTKPYYAPEIKYPELDLGRRVSEAVDLWCVGCVLYHLAVGTPPQTPFLDDACFKEYCEGTYPFPVQALKAKGFSGITIRALAILLAPRPTSRQSAKSILKAFKAMPSRSRGRLDPTLAGATSSQLPQSEWSREEISHNYTPRGNNQPMPRMSQSSVIPAPDYSEQPVPLPAAGMKLINGRKEGNSRSLFFTGVELEKFKTTCSVCHKPEGDTCLYRCLDCHQHNPHHMHGSCAAKTRNADSGGHDADHYLQKSIPTCSANFDSFLSKASFDKTYPTDSVSSKFLKDHFFRPQSSQADSFLIGLKPIPGTYDVEMELEVLPNADTDSQTYKSRTGLNIRKHIGGTEKWNLGEIHIAAANGSPQSLIALAARKSRTIMASLGSEVHTKRVTKGMSTEDEIHLLDSVTVAEGETLSLCIRHEWDKAAFPSDGPFKWKIRLIRLRPQTSYSETKRLGSLSDIRQAEQRRNVWRKRERAEQLEKEKLRAQRLERRRRELAVQQKEEEIQWDREQRQRHRFNPRMGEVASAPVASRAVGFNTPPSRRPGGLYTAPIRSPRGLNTHAAGRQPIGRAAGPLSSHQRPNVNRPSVPAGRGSGVQASTPTPASVSLRTQLPQTQYLRPPANPIVSSSGTQLRSASAPPQTIPKPMARASPAYVLDCGFGYADEQDDEDSGDERLAYGNDEDDDNDGGDGELLFVIAYEEEHEYESGEGYVDEE